MVWMAVVNVKMPNTKIVHLVESWWIFGYEWAACTANRTRASAKSMQRRGMTLEYQYQIGVQTHSTPKFVLFHKFAIVIWQIIQIVEQFLIQSFETRRWSRSVRESYVASIDRIPAEEMEEEKVYRKYSECG